MEDRQLNLVYQILVYQYLTYIQLVGACTKLKDRISISHKPLSLIPSRRATQLKKKKKPLSYSTVKLLASVLPLTQLFRIKVHNDILIFLQKPNLKLISDRQKQEN